MKKANKIIIILIITIFIISVFTITRIKHGTMALDNTPSSITISVCQDLGEAYNDEIYCFSEIEDVEGRMITYSDDIPRMRLNTATLQAAIDEMSEDGIANNTINTVYLPAGTFYFLAGGYNFSRFGITSVKNENVVINAKSNVRIIGAGNDEEGTNTTLKPYSRSQLSNIGKDECYENYEECSYNGLDMFYYGDKDAVTHNPNMKYLENVYYENFIIDSINVHEVGAFNASSKGFMIAPCKNCHWDYVTVMNTGGTGFGMDLVIDGSITNCKAINNGRRAREWAEIQGVDLNTMVGASGFGIGTGLSEYESMRIENCVSIGNAKYGYFFEHQGRFSNRAYVAEGAEGFVVTNCIGENNMYNFGGERADDVLYLNNTSISGENTRFHINFTNESRNVHVENISIQGTTFEDVYTTDYYYDAINWARDNAITTGMAINNFSPTTEATRISALTMLWRMDGMQGDVLHYAAPISGETCGAGGLNPSNNRQVCIETGFTDVSVNSDNTNPIIWGKNNNIVQVPNGGVFRPNVTITTKELLYFVFRYYKHLANLNIDDTEAFNWADEINLFEKMPTECQEETHLLTRAEVVQMLYNYSHSTEVAFPIYYLLMGNGNETITNNNPSYHIPKNGNITLNNPIREGYRATGWIGSNGTILGMPTITNTDTGKKVYVANYEIDDIDNFSFKNNKPYKVDENNKIIYNINLDSTPDLIFNYIDTNYNLNITSNNINVGNSEILKTGDKLIANRNNNINEYILSVRGDIFGTGTISENTAKTIAEHIIEGNIITGNILIYAADYNSDDVIKMNDVMQIINGE